ncbi:MAG: NAD(P)/FAD-dependent oxidoreductase [Acidobacteriales bacterium]|nr:NAD(P)/FAD-dependent oxidoreductase [Terriglobales bacterium]MCI0424073.1 NAD(P)/FAD-dependent oxidoreductase [Acidobacteriota bacterium]MCI0625199.1 NAD(P)/FAD-dependent oxidoreductase [Acidobacteriota bacterium]MCI0723040.1 NAD(P)/FAD-dependent oxidoreductase [Acidobacteriota bacterium]
MNIGIIGAGPAGSLCASRLSRSGARVLLFDRRGAWEKPCGGGVTAKAVARYPLLNGCVETHRRIRSLAVISPRGARTRVMLEEPICIYSRTVLNQLLLDRAVAGGVHFLQARVLDVRRREPGWELLTDRGMHVVDFLVGADGVNSFVRKKWGERFAAADLMMTFGYRIPKEMDDGIAIKFFSKFRGYYWVFPRPNHASFGICGRLSQHNTQTLKQLLHAFLQESGHLSDATEAAAWPMYSALIPSLRPHSLRNNRICGDGWGLAGDAAGFADPITCEGIYYALRSGDLLAEALIEGRAGSYPDRCHADFAADFIHAAELFERFYAGDFLGADFITRMVQAASRSQTLRSVMNAFIAGQQDYRSLRTKLIRKSPRIIVEIAASTFAKFE